MARSIHPYRMAWSIKVARLFGIDIKVHLVFILFMGFLCFWNANEAGSMMAGLQTLLLLTMLFLCVLFHEIGHSLAAKKLGIKVIDITLWPLGGLARLGAIPEIPSVELRIALAGPAVNFALIIAIVILDTLFIGSISFSRLLHPLSPDLNIVEFLVLVNAFMGTLNLLPAFPLDGGRILRALAARRLPYFKATTLAVNTGKVFAVTGLVYLGWNGMIFTKLWLTLICLFIYWAGSTELRAARARELLRAAARRESWYPGPGPQGSDIIDAKVVSAYSPSDEEDGESGDRYRNLPHEDLKRHMKRFDRDFIETMERLKRNDSN